MIRLIKTLHAELGEEPISTIAPLPCLPCLLGSLSRISRIVKVNGFVNATEDFEEHPKILNGASDLLLAVFGPTVGLHARTAIGCASLPFNGMSQDDLLERYEMCL